MTIVPFNGVGAYRVNSKSPTSSPHRSDFASKLRTTKNSTNNDLISVRTAAVRLDVPLVVLITVLEGEGLSITEPIHPKVFSELKKRLTPPDRTNRSWRMKPSASTLQDMQVQALRQQITPPNFPVGSKPSPRATTPAPSSAGHHSRVQPRDVSTATRRDPVRRTALPTQTTFLITGDDGIDWRRRLFNRFYPSAQAHLGVTSSSLTQLEKAPQELIPAVALSTELTGVFNTDRDLPEQESQLLVLQQPCKESPIATYSNYPGASIRFIGWHRSTTAVSVIGWHEVDESSDLIDAARATLGIETKSSEPGALKRLAKLIPSWPWIPVTYTRIPLGKNIVLERLSPEARLCLAILKSTSKAGHPLPVRIPPSTDPDDAPLSTSRTLGSSSAAHLTPATVAHRMSRTHTRGPVESGGTDAPTGIRRAKGDTRSGTTYRTYLEGRDGEDILLASKAVLQRWLNKKYPHRSPKLETQSFEVEFSEPTFNQSHARDVSIEFWSGNLDDGDAIMLHLKERENQEGAALWTTEFTAYRSTNSDESWVAVEVSNDRHLLCATPGFMRPLLSGLTLMDGTGRMQVAPTLVKTEDELLDILEILNDEKRHYPVFVAVSGDTDEHDMSSLTDRVTQWSRKIVGQGHVAILTPESLTLAKEFLSDPLLPQPGSLRTYHPGLNLEDESTWLGHRALSTATLETRSEHQIAGILAAVARSVAQGSSFPTWVGRTSRFLQRQQRLGLEPEIAPATLSPLSIPAPAELAPSGIPSTPTAPAWWHNLEKGILSALSIPEVTDEAIGLVLTSLAQRVERDELWAELELEINEKENAEAEVDLLAEQLGVLEEELANKESEILESERRRRYYQEELAKIDEAKAYLATESNFEEATSFVDVIARLPELRHVAFTGREDDVLELIRSDRGHEAKNAWRALYTLDHFAEHHLQEEVAHLKEFLETNRWGDSKIGVSKWSPTESDSSRTGELGRLRTFPVPEECDQTGQVQMWAHFKLGQTDTRAPRLHYYDDLRGSGKIYVGYIGKHLRNTKTSRT
ncbi:hypothetical protein [Luteococcus japonicus]|uniref:hypothetical protein n=1 Tax=Luteococcus japonicus TaxID=33984 RepID=UPI00117EB6A3|nr:hypothetical protein [Luteococcus japonicus]